MGRGTEGRGEGGRDGRRGERERDGGTAGGGQREGGTGRERDGGTAGGGTDGALCGVDPLDTLTVSRAYCLRR